MFTLLVKYKLARYIAIGLIAGVIISAGFVVWLITETEQDIRRKIEVIYFVSVSCGALLGIFLTAYEMRRRSYAEQVEYSLKYLERWNGDAFKRTRIRCEEIIKSGKCTQQMINTPEDNYYINNYFNFWQEIYMAIHNQKVLKQIMEHCFKQRFLEWTKCFEDWITSEGLRDQEGCQDIKKLALLWKTPPIRGLS